MRVISLYTSRLLKVAALAGLLGLHLYLLMSGQIVTFIAPSYVIIVKISTVLLAVFMIYLLVTFNKKKETITTGLSQVAPFLPIFVALFYIPTNSAVTTVAVMPQSDQVNIDGFFMGGSGGATPEQTENTTLDFTNENFVSLYNMIYSDDTVGGKKITITGFASLDQRVGKGRFIIARMVMVCCAADMIPIGVICQAGEGMEFLDKNWYEVTGILTYEDTSDGSRQPIIMVTGDKKIEQPETPYVY